MNETITIVDPGWDWFQSYMFLILPALLLLVSTVYLVRSFFASTRRTVEDSRSMSGGFALATIVTLGVSALLGGATGAITYQEHLEVAQRQALESSGYESVKFLDSDSGDLFMYASEDGLSTAMLQHVTGNEWLILGGSK